LEAGQCKQHIPENGENDEYENYEEKKLCPIWEWEALEKIPALRADGQAGHRGQWH